jgi:uroporphyrinogen-III synthase
VTPPRVFLSRDPDNAAAFTETLRASGIEVVGCDLVETETIVTPEQADGVIAQCREADILVFTSARALTALAEIAGPAADLSWLTAGGARVICAGEKTAAAALHYGVAVHETISPGGQDRVIAHFDEQIPGGDRGNGAPGPGGSGLRRRIILPRSEAADDRLPEYLRRRGAEVIDLPLYRPRTNHEPECRDAVASARSESPDAVAFTSPSAVAAFLELAALAGRTDAQSYFADTIRIAIGETTAAALVERTGGVEYTSEKRSLQDMAEIACAVLVRRSGAGGSRSSHG